VASAASIAELAEAALAHVVQNKAEAATRGAISSSDGVR
jgi:hypothetical protein